MQTTSTTPGLTFEERRVLRLLGKHTYDEVVEQLGGLAAASTVSLYGVGARKNEARMKERHDQRRQRQAEFLSQILNTTTKCDVLDFLDGLPSDSIRAHVTSIPYNSGKHYGDSPTADNMRFTFCTGMDPTNH